VIGEQDRKVFAKGGYGKHYEMGNKPALLLVDFTYEFTGWTPVPVLDSLDDFPTACGENGWNAVNNTKILLDAARSKGIPVVYTRGDRAFQMGPFNDKKNLPEERKGWGNESKATQIVDELEPLETETVINKAGPSAFWGTPLVRCFVRWQVDTLIVTGGTTSGCVRASVNDAFSMGYRICIPEECVFDRGEVSHKVSLWDMNAKQANVVTVNESLEYIGQV